MTKASRGARLRLDVLRALMIERGLSKGELARRSGLQASTISRLLNGQTTLATGITIAGLMRAFPRHAFDDLFDVGRPTAGPGADDREPADGDYEDDQEAA